MTTSSKTGRGAVLVVIALVIFAVFRDPITAVLAPDPPASPYVAVPGRARGGEDCLAAAQAFNAGQTLASAKALEAKCRRAHPVMGFGACRPWASRAMLVGLYFRLSQTPEAASDRASLKKHRRQAGFAAGLCDLAG